MVTDLDKDRPSNISEARAYEVVQQHAEFEPRPSTSISHEVLTVMMQSSYAAQQPEYVPVAGLPS